MKFSAIFLFFCLLGGSLSAQYIWDGGGDGTSWDDALNWNNDEVPATDSTVIFRNDATVTGTTGTAIPLQIRINANTSVILDLDLTVGNGTTNEHGFVLADTSSLILGSGTEARHIVANVNPGRHGILIAGGTDGASVTVAEGTTFEVFSAVSGINLANATSTVTNNGIIGIFTGVRDGFRITGTFVNNGRISGTQVGRDLFNVKDGGVLTNSETGTIVSFQAGDDGVEILTEATFTNNGVLDVIASNEGGSGNSCIAVGNGEAPAFFINNGNFALLGGGDSLDVRAVTVDSLGQLDNNGRLILYGGNDGSRLFVSGTANNNLNGRIDLDNGRFNVQAGGTFTNNGWVKTTREGSGGFVNGTAINNAFFDYATSNSFAGGTEGNIIDKGISLNNNDTIVNARNQCVADLANTSYEWFLDGVSYATASDTGALAFAEMSLIVDSIVLTTTIPGVSITVRNICGEAVMTNGVFSPRIQAEALTVYPNPAGRNTALTLDLSGMPLAPLDFRVVSAFGQTIGEYRLMGGSLVSLPTTGWKPGAYVVTSVGEERLLVARILVLQ